MAQAWTFLIFTMLLRWDFGFSVISPNQEMSSSEKLYERFPEIRNICPSQCSCDTLSSNLTVNCNSRQLEHFPNNLPDTIFSLNFVGNSMVELSYNISFKKLESLNVSENSIHQVDYMWLGTLVNLHQLDLSKNSLQSKSIENVFLNIPLLSLDLSHNRLTYINDMVVYRQNGLSSLNLSFNRIDTINYNAFCDLTNLVSLDLSHNELTDTQHDWFKNLQNLERLDLKLNRIKFLRNVVFSSLKHLQVLDLSDNDIKSVGLLSFKGLMNLQYFNVSNNHIAHLQEGVFRSLESALVIDLSYNPISVIDKIFSHSRKLEQLYMKNVTSLKELTSNSFIGGANLKLLDLSGSKALQEIDIKAFLYSPKLQDIDLSDANLTGLKMGVFNNLKMVEKLKLNGNPWHCDCYLYWLLIWLGEHSTSHVLSPSETFCNTPDPLKGHVLLDALDHSMKCTKASIYNHTNKTKFKVGSSAFLECKVEGSPLPRLTWMTPQKETFHWDGLVNKSEPDINLTSRLISQGLTSEENMRRFYLMQNGNLGIHKIERGDGGLYVCIASNPLSYESVAIRLTLDYEYFVHIKIISVLVGLAVAFGFLLLTLVSVLIQMILRHFGVKCLCCRRGSASPRTQQIKKILESMEHYKKQQLDRLRGNYNAQAQKIKDNCMQQMERLRESYSSQAECLKDFKDYGTLQIDRIRENYYSQVQRVRDYSASQIIRLRGNYVFQRNRIRKFSAHHLYKLRENYKVQQQHINKILENLNLESCRNVCQRTESMIFESDLNLDNVLVPKICLPNLDVGDLSDSVDNSSQNSAYFTPDDEGSVASEEHDSDESQDFECVPRILVAKADIIVNIENKATSTSDISAGYDDDSAKVSFSNNETIV